MMVVVLTMEEEAEEPERENMIRRRDKDEVDLEVFYSNVAQVIQKLIGMLVCGVHI